MNTDDIAELLHGLPPGLPSPPDRFDQVRRRARGRRHQLAASALTLVAVVALALVLVQPGWNPVRDRATDRGGRDVAAGEPTPRAEPSPGTIQVIELSGPITATGTGTQTIDLGPRPAGATSVAVTLTCVTKGRFRLPDGAGMTCSRTPDPAGDPSTAEMTVTVPPGETSIVLTASPGASWSITTGYVRTETVG